MLLNAQQVSKLLNVGIQKAYKIIRQLNKELEEKGYLTIMGRTEEKYLKERFKIEDGNDR